jgi:uncharacterized protein YndB with AHSA1/START domain
MATTRLISTVIDMRSRTGRDERRPMRFVYDGAVTFHLSAAPNTVFDFITDVDRLPQWNAQIPRVIKSADTLAEGSEWVIVQRGLGPGVQWSSRAQVIELNRATRRFVYRSRSDGPNPSFAMWTWDVAPAGIGSTVMVSWQLNPKTFWRKVLAAGVRHRQLKREVRASLQTMSRLIDVSSRPHNRSNQ